MERRSSMALTPAVPGGSAVTLTGRHVGLHTQSPSSPPLYPAPGSHYAGLVLVRRLDESRMTRHLFVTHCQLFPIIGCSCFVLFLC